MKPSMLLAFVIVIAGATGAAVYYYQKQKDTIVEVNVGSHGVSVQKN